MDTFELHAAKTGMLENKIRKVTDEIKITAAQAIYSYHLPKLSPAALLPSILDKQVPVVISRAIARMP